jgi:hypothetical protein
MKQVIFIVFLFVSSFTLKARPFLPTYTMVAPIATQKYTKPVLILNTANYATSKKSTIQLFPKPVVAPSRLSKFYNSDFIQKGILLKGKRIYLKYSFS